MEMNDLSLTATKREVKGKKVKSLREQGKIPAVLYGHGVKPTEITLDYSSFTKVYRQAGESTLIDLIIDDKKPAKVLIQDVQTNPVNDSLLHIDFLQVRMDEKINARVNLKFVGEAPAVKELSAILVTNINELDIKCLPKDLVHEIEVDLSGLNSFDDIIHVSDLKIPDGIEVVQASDEAVVVVQEPRIEEKVVVGEKELAESESAEEGEKEEAEEGDQAEQKQDSEEKKSAKGGSASGGEEK